jgi:transcriptional regulator with XRE-family HTH domain
MSRPIGRFPEVALGDASTDVRARRLRLHLSQSALAELAGVVQSSVSRAERALFVLPEVLAQITSALDTLERTGARATPEWPCGHRHRSPASARRCPHLSAP